MYEPGEFIIYGTSGVCRVEQVGKPETVACDQSRLYYTLVPVYGSETIHTPVDSRVFMRPVLTREEAQELVERIPQISAEGAYTDKSFSMLTTHYQTSLQSHDCEDLVQLIKSVYQKNQDATQNGKKLGLVDQRYWKRAEDLLYGELAVALDIPRDDVLGYIQDTAERPEAGNGGETGSVELWATG